MFGDAALEDAGDCRFGVWSSRGLAAFRVHMHKYLQGCNVLFKSMIFEV